ncbi:MAG: hypothetical protein SGPRY_007735 [Prymnesium sp.]
MEMLQADLSDQQQQAELLQVQLSDHKQQVELLQAQLSELQSTHAAEVQKAGAGRAQLHELEGALLEQQKLMSSREHEHAAELEALRAQLESRAPEADLVLGGSQLRASVEMALAARSPSRSSCASGGSPAVTPFRSFEEEVSRTGTSSPAGSTTSSSSRKRRGDGGKSMEYEKLVEGLKLEVEQARAAQGEAQRKAVAARAQLGDFETAWEEQQKLMKLREEQSSEEIMTLQAQLRDSCTSGEIQDIRAQLSELRLERDEAIAAKDALKEQLERGEVRTQELEAESVTLTDQLQRLILERKMDMEAGNSKGSGFKSPFGSSKSKTSVSPRKP